MHSLIMLHAVLQAGNNALHHAAVSGNAALTKLLLAIGKAGPQAQAAANNSGRTPLHIAASLGRGEVAQLLLLQQQADVIKAADKVG
jgi:ankyrin repeat protein